MEWQMDCCFSVLVRFMSLLQSVCESEQLIACLLDVGVLFWIILCCQNSQSRECGQLMLIFLCGT